MFLISSLFNFLRPQYLDMDNQLVINQIVINQIVIGTVVQIIKHKKNTQMSDHLGRRKGLSPVSCFNRLFISYL